MHRTTRGLLAACALLLMLPATALADASLLTSTPFEDEVVTALPPSIVLTFDEPLASESSFVVLDADGTTVAIGAPRVGIPTTLSAATPGLADGKYQVRWTALSADGHVKRGAFYFTVALQAEPSATPSPGPTTAPTTASPAAAPTPSSAPTAPPAAGEAGGGDDGATGSGTDVLVPILVVALAITLGFALMVRRRGST